MFLFLVLLFLCLKTSKGELLDEDIGHIRKPLEVLRYMEFVSLDLKPLMDPVRLTNEIGEFLRGIFNENSSVICQSHSPKIE